MMSVWQYINICQYDSAGGFELLHRNSILPLTSYMRRVVRKDAQIKIGTLGVQLCLKRPVVNSSTILSNDLCQWNQRSTSSMTRYNPVTCTSIDYLLFPSSDSSPSNCVPSTAFWFSTAPSLLHWIQCTSLSLSHMQISSKYQKVALHIGDREGQN